MYLILLNSFPFFLIKYFENNRVVIGNMKQSVMVTYCGQLLPICFIDVIFILLSTHSTSDCWQLTIFTEEHSSYHFLVIQHPAMEKVDLITLRKTYLDQVKTHT